MLSVAIRGKIHLKRFEEMLPEALSRQHFVLIARVSHGIFPCIHNLEEELIAMLRPGAKVHALITEKITEQQKDEARARILAKLVSHGPVTGTWSEIQEALGLQDISMGLLKKSCWHLRDGDRDHERLPRISVTRSVDGAHWSKYGHSSYTVRAL